MYWNMPKARGGGGAWAQATRTCPAAATFYMHSAGRTNRMKGEPANSVLSYHSAFDRQRQAGRNDIISCFTLVLQRAGHARMFTVEQTGSAHFIGHAPGPLILLPFQAQPPGMQYGMPWR